VEDINIMRVQEKPSSEILFMLPSLLFTSNRKRRRRRGFLNPLCLQGT